MDKPMTQNFDGTGNLGPRPIAAWCPLAMRAQYALMPVMALVCLSLGAIMLRSAWIGYRTGDAEFAGTTLGALLITSLLALFMSYVLLSMSWSYRFILFHYSLTEGRLAMYDPLFRKRWFMDLKEVHTIAAIYVPLAPSDGGGGHRLVAGNGVFVELADSLPIWPAIQSDLSESVEVTTQKWQDRRFPGP